MKNIIDSWLLYVMGGFLIFAAILSDEATELDKAAMNISAFVLIAALYIVKAIYKQKETE